MKKKSMIILVVIVIAALAAYQLLLNDQYLSDNYISKNNNPSKPINSHIQEKANTDDVKTEYSRNNMFTYGQSGMNTPLMAYKVNNQCPSRKILCVFAIHGFEDAFFKDRQALVDTANGVIEYHAAVYFYLFQEHGQGSDPDPNSHHTWLDKPPTVPWFLSDGPDAVPGIHCL